MENFTIQNRFSFESIFLKSKNFNHALFVKVMLQLKQETEQTALDMNK